MAQWWKRFGNSGTWIYIYTYIYIFRFRFFVQSLEITVSLYQVYNLVFISIYVRISMNLVSKWPVPAWGTTHSLRPEGREWRILWASWHAVTGSNCHVRTGRCYRNCFFHVQIVFCWKHCSQVLTKVVSESLFFVLLWGCDVIEWFSISNMEKTTGNTWKYDFFVDPMTHSRQRTLKDTVVPWGCGRSCKTCWVARGSDHRSSMFNEAMWNKSGFLALLAVRNCSRWVFTKNRGTGHRALEVGIFWPGWTVAPCDQVHVGQKKLTDTVRRCNCAVHPT